jgi:hypothetical protein
MSFDELQLAWQQQRTAEPAPRVSAETLQEVRAKSRAFARLIFWRDVREVLASFLVAGVFGHIGWQAHREGAVAWPAGTAAALALGVGLYFLADRLVMRRRTGPRGGDVRTELGRAIAAVEHQIWLLRNVVWWYIAPLALSTILLGVQITFFGPADAPLWSKIMVWVLILGTTGWVDRWIWQLNQTAVRNDLEPRLQKLQAQRREFDNPQ